MSTTTVEGFDDRQLFDAAMSDPEPVQQETPAREQPSEPQGQPRDEQGRFAAKTAAEAPEQPKPTTQAEPPQATPEPSQDDQAAIPSWRLREVTQERNAEREARQRYEAQSREAMARVQAMEAELEKLRNPPAPTPDFFENPAAATEAAIEAALRKMVGPQLGQIHQTQQQLAQAVAETRYGADKIKAAQDAFFAALDNRTLSQGDYNEIVNSPNRYAAAVEWHNRRSVFEQVGNDPEAWFNKRLETWMADPKNQAAVIERARTGAQVQNGNSRQPTVQLPPSLSRVSGTAANMPDDQDMSDQAVFRRAMS